MMNNNFGCSINPRIWFELISLCHSIQAKPFISMKNHYLMGDSKSNRCFSNMKIILNHKKNISQNLQVWPIQRKDSNSSCKNYESNIRKYITMQEEIENKYKKLIKQLDEEENQEVKITTNQLLNRQLNASNLNHKIENIHKEYNISRILISKQKIMEIEDALKITKDNLC